MNVGDQLGPYELRAVLGRGGMGEVYRAMDRRLHRDVALKVIDGDRFSDPSARNRFEQEARALAALNHPNVVVVFDVGLTNTAAYIAMELVDGPSMRQLLRGGAIEVARVLEIMVQVAQGLAEAHAAGIVHRDLKPENVMLNTRGVPKIVDFGIAKRFSREPADDASTAALTGAGVVPGTLAYLAPEQLRGGPAVIQTDQFAFGLLAYEMLSGVHPFVRASPLQTLSAILEQPPRALREFQPAIPVSLWKIVARCLAKAADRRYGATADLALDLMELQDRMLKRPSGRHAPRRRASERVTSIVVLPFLNLDHSPDIDHLADGLTEHMIGSLSKLPALRIMARSTVFQFKDSDWSPQRIGLELGVRIAVVGTFGCRGDSLIANVEVVDVRDGSRLFGKEFVGSVNDVIAFYEEVAIATVASLEIKVTSDQHRRLAGPPTADNAAYVGYLKGCQLWNHRTPAGLRGAMEQFHLAIELDPQFALPYVGLADAYIVAGVSEVDPRPPREAMPRARAAAEKAIAIDPMLAEAHVAYGAVKLWFDWDWVAAENEFVRAARLNPGYAPAQYWFAELLLAMGRFEAALARAERARKLDPLAETPVFVVGRVLYMSRQYERAIYEMRRALQFEERVPRLHYILASCYLKVGEPELAVAAAARAHELSSGQPFALALLAHVYAQVEKREEAKRLFAELLAKRTSRYICPYYCALVQAGLGHHDEAFRWLEEALIERPSWMAYLNVAPILDGIRTDARFGELINHLRLDAPVRSTHQ